MLGLFRLIIILQISWNYKLRGQLTWLSETYYMHYNCMSTSGLTSVVKIFHLITPLNGTNLIKEEEIHHLPVR